MMFEARTHQKAVRRLRQSIHHDARRLRLHGPAVINVFLCSPNTASISRARGTIT